MIPVEGDALEFARKAVNAQGVLFHRRCIQEIASLESWQVKDRERPIVLNGERSRIDIYAVRDASPTALHAIIECKKADSDFKSWVFFPERKEAQNDWSVVPYSNNMLVESLQRDATTKKPAVNHVVRPVDLLDNRKKPIEMAVCDEGFELRYDHSSSGKLNMKAAYKGLRKSTVEDATRQVLLQQRGFSMQLRQKLGSIFAELTDTREHLILPIITTTAKLLVCDTNTREVNLASGELEHEENIAISVQPWLLYKYKPEFLFDPELEVIPIEPKHHNTTALRHTLNAIIVNSEHLYEFLDSIQFLR